MPTAKLLPTAHCRLQHPGAHCHGLPPTATAELQRIAAQMEALRLGKEEAERAAAAATAAAAHAPAPNRTPTLKHPSAPIKRFPTKAEVEQFLWSANIFHTASHTDPDQRIMVTSTYLADPDAQWLRALCATRDEAGLPVWMDWATFARDLTARHTSAMHHDNVRDQFVAVHQTGSVTSFIASFNQLVQTGTCVFFTGTAERRSTFMRGLESHVKTQVYLHCREGEDLEAVMALAEKVDDITYNPVSHRSHPLTPTMRPPFPASQDPQSMRPLSPATQGPEPMELGAMQHAFPSAAAPTDRLAAVSVPRTLLTVQQRAALFVNDGGPRQGTPCRSSHHSRVSLRRQRPSKTRSAHSQTAGQLDPPESRVRAQPRCP